MGTPANVVGWRKEEGPQHEVILRAFAIGKYPVTFEEFDKFAATTGRSLPRDWGWHRGIHPVIDVSWKDAAAYAKWLSEQTGKCYRLPSEAEWEYACRAGTRTPWSFGDKHADLAQCAWYWENSDERPHPVGEKNPNPWGLHDVHGNVWEWVQDCWHDNYEGAPTDGSAWKETNDGDCSQRVVRGGSWGSAPGPLRSADRDRANAGARNGNLGFRLAQDF